jgi:predicted TPR repeat methyltransferase
MATVEADGQAPREGAAVELSLDQALAIAIGWHRRGKYADAARVYLQILEVAPNHVDALHFMGVAEQQAGRSAAALEYLDRALALAPDHPDALCNRGNVHRVLGHLDQAEADYQHALDQRPDNPNALANLAIVIRARGDWEGAVAALRSVLARHPDHATAWLNLANTLQNMDRYAEAIEAYEQAVKFAPESPVMFRDMGLALYAEGRVKDAIGMYRLCLSLAPDDARAKHLLAGCTGENIPVRATDDYVRAEFDIFAATFDAKLARLEYRGPEIIVASVKEIVDTLPSAPDVLDAGCGTGLCAPVLRPLAGRLVGVDLSAAMVALARTRGGYDDLVVAELTSFMREHERCFDLIVSTDTLIYFGALGEVVAAAKQALRPGGVLAFSLECAEAAEAPEGFCLRPHGRYSHTRAYVEETLRQVGMAEATVTEAKTRKESQHWVEGWLVRARRPGRLQE